MDLTFIQPGSIVRGIENNRVVGTAICYYDGSEGTQCQPYGDQTIERLAPGCLDECLTRSKDIIATFDHKQSNLLGRTPVTLSLVPTPTGLDVVLDLPETTLGRDVGQLIARGDIRGFSFIAKPKQSTWSKDNGKNVLTIRSFEKLYEVSLVVNPYYTSAQIKRGQDWHSQEYDLEQTRLLIEKVKKLK